MAGLSPGSRWFDFWTGEQHRGPGGVTLAAPLDRLPLLVRAGAIIPLGPLVQHTGERPLDELTLQIYPHGTSRFELYEDDGRSNAYRRGLYALTPITCVAQAGRVTFRIGAPTGDRSVVPAGRRSLLRLRLERPNAVSVEGAGDLSHTRSDIGRPGWWMDKPGFSAYVRPRSSRLSWWTRSLSGKGVGRSGPPS